MRKKKGSSTKTFYPKLESNHAQLAATNRLLILTISNLVAVEAAIRKLTYGHFAGDATQRSILWGYGAFLRGTRSHLGRLRFGVVLKMLSKTPKK